jgi:hypothetical protein
MRTHCFFVSEDSTILLRMSACQLLILLVISASCFGQTGNQHGQPQKAVTCKTLSACNQRGTAALKAGRTEEAIKLFEEQVRLAELFDIERQQKAQTRISGLCQSALTAYNNLAVAYMHKGDYLQARAWAATAIACDKKDQAAQFNMRKIEERLSSSPRSKSPAGTYVQYAGRASWQTFVVETIDGNPSLQRSIHFCFSGLYWGMGEGPSGLGDLEGTAPMPDMKAEYFSHEFSDKGCTLTLEFHPNRLEVLQTGDDVDCGFGHNVDASGTYLRVSAGTKCSERER